MKGSVSAAAAAASLLLLLVCSNLPPVASKVAPWQTTHSAPQEALTEHADIPPSLFGPNGHLYSVQHLSSQITILPGNTVIALLCRDGVVVLTTEPTSPYLAANTPSSDDSLLLPPTHNTKRPPSTVAPFCQLQKINNRSDTLLAVTAGDSVDSAVLRHDMQSIATQLRKKQCISLFAVAKRLADRLQIRTQQNQKGRLLAAVAILFGGNELWRVDLTGQFYSCRFVVSGRYAPLLRSALYHQLYRSSNNGNDPSARDIQSRLSQLSMEQGLELAQSALQSVHDTLTRKTSAAEAPPNQSKKPLWPCCRAVSIRNDQTVSWSTLST